MISRWPLAARLALGLLLGVGLVWAGLRWRGSAFTANPSRIVLEADQATWPGFTAAQQQGLLMLTADALESGAGLPVVLATDLLAPHPEPAAVLQLGASLTAEGLRLEAHLRHPGGRSERWSASGAPQPCLQALFKRFHLQASTVLNLVPASQAAFLDLLEVSGWDSDLSLPQNLKLAHALVLEAPGCATAWLALARLEHRALVIASNPEPQGQEKCREHFEQALVVVPLHPRTINQYSTYLTDTGNQREALTLLAAAIRAHPRVTQLRSALAYSARTAGLLDVGLNAVEARDRLQGVTKAGKGLAENVYLYRGDYAQFAHSLGVHNPRAPEPILDFYRGYLFLIQSNRTAALREFQLTKSASGSKVLFESIAQIYALALEGNLDAALKALDALRDQRLRLRVPDGEFTFKIAEAYGFLGRQEEALSIAERAFSQGFGCTQWYERSPFLEGVRETPRWRALIQHMKERQTLLASRFPARAFR